MKCDELKPIFIPTRGITGDTLLGVRYYPSNAVDASIDELKAENERLVKCCKEYDSRQRIDERIKFNGAQQLRTTKRALWIARASRAKVEYQYWIFIQRCEYTNHHFFINKSRYKHTSKVDRLRYPWEWSDIWIEVEKRCIKKAEEYK